MQLLLESIGGGDKGKEGEGWPWPTTFSPMPCSKRSKIM